jgi:hypothetical protein
MAQVFDPTGAKIGNEFLVNTTTQGNQVIPTIAQLSDGNIVIAWDDGSSADSNGIGYSIKAQILGFNALVTSISATTDTGATELNAGHVVTISLGLDKPLYVTGHPFLLLNDSQIANYSSGSGTDHLTFSYTVHQGDNTADLQVTGLNLNGGSIQDAFGTALSGPVQGDLALQIDTIPPNITINQKLANDTGFSHTDLITSDGHVALWGTVSDVNDPNGISNVEVFDGKTDLGPATVSNGAWTFSTLLGEGSHALYAVATDDAGNQATTQTEPTIVVDTTPPIPFMSDVVKNSNNSLTTLSGMSEADSSVSVFDGKTLLGTVTADSSGDWSLQANISGGTHQFTETSTDVAGNTGYSAGVTVYSPGGNKTLTGGSGNDFLIAGKNDVLIGGPGNDTFVFNPGFGKETVADFNPNQDQLAFNHALFAQSTAAFVLNQTHDTSFGAEIVVDPHDTITLPGVTTAQLAAHASDFHFF